MRAKFFIVDDSDPFRKAVSEYLQNELNCQVLGEATNGAEALKNNKILIADIIIMDIIMKELDGINTARKLLWEFPNLKILAVTGNEESVFLRQLVHTGFYGCVFKNQLFEDLGMAINQLLKGKRFFPKTLQL
ncbi:MAG: response regulator transcription factor [Marinilabiliaceae bacterium]|nr:response regulator transcription factor [Marinilabiliaceae bacterium]